MSAGLRVIVRQRLGWRMPIAALALSLVTLALVASGAVSTTVPGGPEAAPEPAIVLRPAVFDDAAFDTAVRRTASTPLEPMVGVKAAVFPHHWFAGHLITGTIRDLAASGTYQRVILLGPNHVNSGRAGAVTSDSDWQTVAGHVAADREAVDALVSTGVAGIEPDVLAYEHSISGIVPAIAYYLPEARIVPITLRSGLTAVEVDALATAIAGMMDEHTVLLASVDFSHYLQPEAARERDAESIEAMRALDAARVLGWDNAHMDSPAAIAVVIEAMRAKGATEFELRVNTNSAELGEVPNEPATSYVTGFYH